jgi:2-oxo-3-hexenedioate decarboxylase
MTANPEAIARAALAAFDTRRQVEPFTSRFPDFDAGQAYAAAATIRRLRQARGEQPAGRKIGFTNRDLWTQYNVDRPIWGDMYAHSIGSLDPSETISLASLCEPLIEPEIVLRLSRAPAPGMDEFALLACVEWAAHGFEIVHSIYPGWKFAAADTIAGFGMLAVTPENCERLFAELTGLTVTLARDGVTVESGRGSNVLGGPLSALRRLVELLADDPHNPPLAAGEIVTTGTLTRAYPIKPGEIWSTRMSGIPIAGLTIRFG